MSTLGRLAVRMRQLDKSLTKKASKAAAQVALEIVKELAHTTPADTSKAISNWVVTLTKPSVKLLPAHVPGEEGDTAGASAKVTINLARLTLRTKKPGHAIYITNNVPYLKYLNEGTSDQAPAAFVERAFQKALKTFKVTKLED